ncbi:hypothetical protein BKA70DRAFT_1421695 [Coprinopsis sp. MPI-PUGE-AT-0042]|nr:hypothetical protein BKA70DRAFT_1421695 [Coprinopsis sp. MPI-PUGE-AT-0042]
MPSTAGSGGHASFGKTGGGEELNPTDLDKIFEGHSKRWRFFDMEGLAGAGAVAGAGGAWRGNIPTSSEPDDDRTALHPTSAMVQACQPECLPAPHADVTTIPLVQTQPAHSELYTFLRTVSKILLAGFGGFMNSKVWDGEERTVEGARYVQAEVAGDDQDSDCRGRNWHPRVKRSISSSIVEGKSGVVIQAGWKWPNAKGQGCPRLYLAELYPPPPIVAGRRRIYCMGERPRLYSSKNVIPE